MSPTSSPTRPAATRGAASVGASVLLTGVAKSFGATRALVRADLDVRSGEVHTVMGENGSGKSTLVKILSGVHRADSGEVTVGGAPASRWRSPADARTAGVATVFQEVLTVPGRSIAENVWLGAGATPDRAGRERTATDVLERLLGEQVDVTAPVDSLSLSGRQACCIARSLVRRPEVLVLDESTSALDVATRDRLFVLVRELTAAGGSVVFISHRMDEVFEITDVITVLRAGTTIAARLACADTTAAGLVELMSGSASRVRAASTRTTGAPVLDVRGLVLAPGAAPIDLQVRAGELVGLAGLEGQGQDRFLLGLRGAPVVEGTVQRVGGAGTGVVDSPTAARRCGIAYVPRERRHEALFQQLSIRENFGMATLGRDTVAGLVRPPRTTRRLDSHAPGLRMTLRSADAPVSTLSGGNQQKVVLARALAENPAVLLLNDPTRGIDPAAKHDVYELLERLCTAGTAVVVLSSEVDELVELADRVLVFRDHTVGAVIDRAGLTRAAVVAAYFGLPVPGSTTLEAP